jgi:hypothetical protein
VAIAAGCLIAGLGLGGVFMAQQGASYVDDLGKHGWNPFSTAQDALGRFGSAFDSGDYYSAGAMTGDSVVAYTADVLTIAGGIGAYRALTGASGAAAGAGAGASRPSITGFRGSTNPNTPFHALDRAISRGVRPADILDITNNPAARLVQGDRTVYLSARGGVVLDSRGQVVTVWSANEMSAENLLHIQNGTGMP